MLLSRSLPLDYTYRANDDGVVTYSIIQGGSNATYRLHTMEFAGVEPVVGEVVVECPLPELQRGDLVSVNLLKPSISVNGHRVPADMTRREARKFVSELRLTAGDGQFSRLCSHYLPFQQKAIGNDYYFGDDYVDYPRQTAAADGVSLVKQHCPGGRLLDIGCALGIYTQAFREAGFDAFGMDISEFAVAEAAKRVGADRARCASLETTGIPFEGNFDVIWMWDVLEHFADPRAALARVTERVARGGWLFLHTSNADSLTHRMFGADWEGYSDYSHYGVDLVTCSSLRAWLRELTWETKSWQCRNIWVEGLDPVVLQLRQVFLSSPQLQVLLEEADLGDAIRVVGRKA